MKKSTRHNDTHQKNKNSSLSILFLSFMLNVAIKIVCYVLIMLGVIMTSVIWLDVAGPVVIGIRCNF